MQFFRTGLALLLTAGLTGCDGDADAPAPGASDQESEHAHAAPRGGILVELGDHAANLEVVVDVEAGRLQLYLLDAHAENPIRITDESIAAELVLKDAATRAVEFHAVASSLTGETIGDTSEFEYRDTTSAIAAVERIRIPGLSIRGTPFENIEIDIHSEHGD